MSKQDFFFHVFLFFYGIGMIIYGSCFLYKDIVFEIIFILQGFVCFFTNALSLGKQK
jgi:hypothetical protein